MPWHIGRFVVKTLPRSKYGRPRLPLAGPYHCYRCRWTKPSLCRSILGRPTQRHVSVVGAPNRFLSPTLVDLAHTNQLLQGAQLSGRIEPAASVGPGDLSQVDVASGVDADAVRRDELARGLTFRLVPEACQEVAFGIIK